jgi:ABC-type multidrug transport system ATPase subunit
VGPNGAGKTSLLLAILGVIPSNGVIERTFTSFELGVVWQDRCLPLNVSVKNWLSYLAGIFNQPLDLELLERFNIRNDSKLIRTMSGGEAQKLAIVSAFFHKPKIPRSVQGKNC